MLIYVKALNEEIHFDNKKGGFENVEKGQIAQLETMRKEMGSPYWEFCCHLYDGVKDFFVYKENGKLGHISWVYYKDDPNRFIDLGADEGEIKYCLTLPQFRGKGIYPATLVRIQSYLRKNGYKRVFVCVRDDNRASIRGIEKAGFTFAAKVNVIKIIGMQVNRRYATSH